MEPIEAPSYFTPESFNKVYNFIICPRGYGKSKFLEELKEKQKENKNE